MLKPILQNSILERELNLLNSLIGKDNLEKEAFDLIKDYPEVIKAFPILIATREKSVDILTDVKHFIYKKYVFTKHDLSDIRLVAPE